MKKVMMLGAAALATTAVVGAANLQAGHAQSATTVASAAPAATASGKSAGKVSTRVLVNRLFTKASKMKQAKAKTRVKTNKAGVRRSEMQKKTGWVSVESASKSFIAFEWTVDYQVFYKKGKLASHRIVLRWKDIWMKPFLTPRPGNAAYRITNSNDRTDSIGFVRYINDADKVSDATSGYAVFDLNNRGKTQIQFVQFTDGGLNEGSFPMIFDRTIAGIWGRS